MERKPLTPEQIEKLMMRWSDSSKIFYSLSDILNSSLLDVSRRVEDKINDICRQFMDISESINQQKMLLTNSQSGNFDQDVKRKMNHEFELITNKLNKIVVDLQIQDLVAQFIQNNVNASVQEF